MRCELLSNFLYFCSRNNLSALYASASPVWIALKFFVLLQSKQLRNHLSCRNAGVNCSQIFCTFAVETTKTLIINYLKQVWIALKFFVLLQSKQLGNLTRSQRGGCELLSNFLYFCSRNNSRHRLLLSMLGVNCSQIFCTFAVETTSGVLPRYTYLVWIALKFFVLLQSKQRERSSEKSAMRCELLSNFLYFCSRNNFF